MPTWASIAIRSHWPSKTTSRPTSPTIPGTSRASTDSAVNIEQNLTRYLTAFTRFGWDNGKTESFAYTEVDQTFAGRTGSERRLVASQAGSRRCCFCVERNQEGSPDLPCRWRTRLPSRRWQAQLRPRKYSGNLLHSPRLARHLLSRPACNTSLTPATTATAARVLVPPS